MRQRSPKRRTTGTVSVFTAMILPVLVALVALSVDVGNLWLARTQLQAAADSAALAAMGSLRQSPSYGTAAAQASAIAAEHHAAGDPVDVDPSGDVDFGFYDYGSRTFTSGSGFGAPAVRVVAGRGPGTAAGPVPLFFARILGREEANVSAEAVASIRRRDLILVQDRTASFQDEFPTALEADGDLVEAMEDQGLPGDRMGVISFARDTTDEANLTALSGGGVSSLLGAIGNMQVCTGAGSPGGPCYGTDIGIGIDAALTMLQDQSPNGDAERVMIIVSDGVPCFLERGSQAVSAGQAAATAAADRAGDAGLSIFVITLDAGGGGGPCMGGDPTFNESLARGFGRGFTTTNPEDLDELLTSILTQMPAYLVR